MKSDDILKKFEESQRKIKDFGDLLDSMATVDDKRKMLWKDIYQNAVTDRENAHALYINLYMTMQGGSGEHVTVGPTLVKYLERMSKANDQLLKLAEIIKDSKEAETQMTEEELFSKISEN
jgi:hypothetical protein